MNEDFVSELQYLVGQTCWGYIGGHPIGSIITLDFGEKVKRDRILKNGNLSTDQRHYVGEFSLMIWCAWRLDKKDKVICSWNDGNDKNGLMREGLNGLVNKGVVSVRVEAPAYDLILQFENELSLKIFCDQTNPEEADENYTFFVKDFTYTVELKGIVTKAGRSNREVSLP